MKPVHFFSKERPQSKIKSNKPVVDINENFHRVRRILWIILFINLAVAAIKIVFGTIVKSNSMTADGFHSLTDGSSNIVGLIGIRLASRPVDEDHPYGHNKYETLSGLLISGILFVLGGRIIVDAAQQIIHPVTPEITLESLIMLLVTLVVNILVSTTEFRKGKELGSQILISDSLHTRSDIFISLGVLVTLTGIKLGLTSIIDPVVSLVVSGFIIHAAYEIFKLNRDVLVDRAVVDADKIRTIAIAFDEVLDTHLIRSRGERHALFIDMHIMTKPDLSIEQSHQLIHNIENQIRRSINENAQVTAHLEPYEESNSHHE